MKDHYRHVHAGYRYVCLGCSTQSNWRNTVNTHINSTACKGSSYEEQYIAALDEAKPKNDVSKPVPRVSKRASLLLVWLLISLREWLCKHLVWILLLHCLFLVGSAHLLSKQAVENIRSNGAVIGVPFVPSNGSDFVDALHCTASSTSTVTSSGLAPLYKIAGIEKPVAY